MKLIAVVLIVSCMLTGCTTTSAQIDQGIALRKQIINAQSCSFDAVITADYTDVIYTFQMNCQFNSLGELSFTVTDPDTISGITGTVSSTDAELTFEGMVLAFPVLADGRITPVCGPWLFINTLKAGYLSGCSSDASGLCLYLDDNYEDNPLQLIIQTDTEHVPIYAEVFWQNRRVLSLDIKNFSVT